MNNPDWNQEVIASRLETKWAGRELLFRETTDSTFADLEKMAAAGAPHGAVAAADKQEAGRGRRGRNWTSPAGENIYFSILLRPDWEAERLPLVTLAMALAAALAIRETAKLPALIKWPNDVVLNGRKVTGILTELKQIGGNRCVLIGTGINVNQSLFAESIRETASSLLLEGGAAVNRSLLTAALLGQFEIIYERLEADSGFSGLQSAYEALLANLGRQVRVLDPKGEYGGTARGITEKGELLVEREDGRLVAVYAGEVSVRGICGYV